MSERSKQTFDVTREIQRMNLAEKSQLEKLGYVVDDTGDLIVKENSKESLKIFRLAEYLKISATRESNGLVRLDLKGFLKSQRNRLILPVALLLVGLSLSIVPESGLNDVEASAMDLNPSVVTVTYSSDNKTYEPTLASGLVEAGSGNQLLLRDEEIEPTFRAYRDQLEEFGIDDASELERAFKLSTQSGVELYTFITTADGRVFAVYSSGTGENSASGEHVISLIIKEAERNGDDLIVDGEVIISNDQEGRLQVAAFPGATRTVQAPDSLKGILKL